jgi:transposase-like protein
MIQGLQTGCNMRRKPRVARSPKEKWQIIQEGMKSGNVSETCRRHGIAANLFYRWKDEAELVAATQRKSSGPDS